jgi:hypothetical protein
MVFTFYVLGWLDHFLMIILLPQTGLYRGSLWWHCRGENCVRCHMGLTASLDWLQLCVCVAAWGGGMWQSGGPRSRVIICVGWILYKLIIHYISLWWESCLIFYLKIYDTWSLRIYNFCESSPANWQYNKDTCYSSNFCSICFRIIEFVFLLYIGLAYLIVYF